MALALGLGLCRLLGIWRLGQCDLVFRTQLIAYEYLHRTWRAVYVFDAFDLACTHR